MEKQILDLNKNKNLYLHFTAISNLPGISKNGLIAQIGQNAVGVEHQNKVFFVDGLQNELRACEMWLRWFLWKQVYKEVVTTTTAQLGDAYKKMQQGEIPFDAGIDKKILDENYLCASKKFSNGQYFTEQNLQTAYAQFYDMCKSNVVLVLDLVEGDDFDRADTDEPKKYLLERYGREFLDAMYFKSTKDDKEPYKMEGHNMHLKVGKGCEPQKISYLCTQNGDFDMLAILQEIHKGKQEVYPLLDNFIGYSKDRQNQQTFQKS